MFQYISTAISAVNQYVYTVVLQAYFVLVVLVSAVARCRIGARCHRQWYLPVLPRF